MEEPEWWGDEPEDDEPPDHTQALASQQFIVTDNPVIGILYGPDGEELFTLYERDDRFGFLKWAEDR